jgi:hypothetical protein
MFKYQFKNMTEDKMLSIINKLIHKKAPKLHMVFSRDLTTKQILLNDEPISENELQELLKELTTINYN